MSFNHDFEAPSIDITTIYGFEITAFPPAKLKYASLERKFNGTNLKLYEDRQGEYHLERISSPTEDAEVILSSNLWDEATKKCEIAFTYTDLRFKSNTRKEVVEFGEEISSLINWRHKIVWFTDDGDVTEWKNSDEILT